MVGPNLFSSSQHRARKLSTGVSEPLTDVLWKQLPLWGLVSFGAYLLFKLGWGVFMFNDVPEAHKELMNDIKMAREELRAKGIDVD